MAKEQERSAAPDIEDIIDRCHRVYTSLDERVIARQRAAGQVLMTYAIDAANARMIDGKTGEGLESKKYIVDLQLKKLTFRQDDNKESEYSFSFDGNGSAEEKYCPDYLGYMINESGNLTIIRVKTAESDGAKEVRRFSFNDEEIHLPPTERRVGWEEASKELRKRADSPGKSPEETAWFLELYGVINHLGDLERKVDIKMMQTIADYNKRAELIEKIQSLANKIEENFIDRHYTGKMGKLIPGNGLKEELESASNVPWPIQNSKVTDMFYSKMAKKHSEEMWAWGRGYLELLLEKKFRSEVQFPRLGILLPAYAIVAEKLGERRWEGEAPKLENFFALANAAIEFEGICSSIPKALTNEQRDNFIFANKAMRRLAAVLKKGMLAMQELEALGPEISLEAQKLVQLALIEYGKTDTGKGENRLDRLKAGKEWGLLDRLEALIGQKEGKRADGKDSVYAPYIQGLPQYRKILEKVQEAVESFDEIKVDFRGKRGGGWSHLTELVDTVGELWKASPVEAKVLWDYLRRILGHNKYKQGHSFPSDIRLILTPEEKMRARIELDHAQANKDNISPYLREKIGYLEGARKQIGFGGFYLEDDVALMTQIAGENVKLLEMVKNPPEGYNAEHVLADGKGYRLEDNFFDIKSPEAVIAELGSQRKPARLLVTYSQEITGTGKAKIIVGRMGCQEGDSDLCINVEVDTPSTREEVKDILNKTVRSVDDRVLGELMNADDFDRLSGGEGYPAWVAHAVKELEFREPVSHSLSTNPSTIKLSTTFQRQYMGYAWMREEMGVREIIDNPPSIVRVVSDKERVIMRGGAGKAARATLKGIETYLKTETLRECLSEVDAHKYGILVNCLKSAPPQASLPMQPRKSAITPRQT